MSEAGEPESKTDTARRSAWQYRLLPLMGGLLVLSALFFAVTSVLELREFYRQVAHERIDLQAQFDRYEEVASPADRANREYLRFQVLSRLEADALQRRYRQANATMLARVWTRHLGFTTGMILAMVGAAFILGQLREDRTTLKVGSERYEGAVATSSPGIVLAVLGTGLMALTIWVPFGIETRDVNIYLRDPTMTALPPPGRHMPEETAAARSGDGGPGDDPGDQAADAREERLFGPTVGGSQNRDNR